VTRRENSACDTVCVAVQRGPLVYLARRVAFLPNFFLPPQPTFLTICLHNNRLLCDLSSHGSSSIKQSIIHSSSAETFNRIAKGSSEDGGAQTHFKHAAQAGTNSTARTPFFAIKTSKSDLEHQEWRFELCFLFNRRRFGVTSTTK